ncbi:MAG: type II toxin-antitoxin system Phd/YefM family antitoxin [Caulobacterales bacterium]
MASYSVAEAKNQLPSLINKAMAGEEVVITRHGKPVADLKGRRTKTPEERAALYERLREHRESGPDVGISSVELLNEMYDEPDV